MSIMHAQANMCTYRHILAITGTHGHTQANTGSPRLAHSGLMQREESIPPKGGC